MTGKNERVVGNNMVNSLDYHIEFTLINLYLT